MTLADAGEIFAYWERHPPAHLILQTIARMLGWTPQPANADTPATAALAVNPPPGLAVASRGGGLDMPAPLLDAAALRERNRARALTIAARNRQASQG